MAARKQRFRRLLEDGPSMSAKEVLDEVDRIGGEHLRPTVDVPVKVDLHHHFVASKNPRRRARQVKAFWKAAEKSGLDAVALTTHSNIQVGVNPELIYRELNQAMPKRLKDRGFKLLAGLEVLCKGGVEVGVISPDPDILFGDGFWFSRPNTFAVAEKIQGDERLLGYIPHAFYKTDGAAHEGNLGLDETRRLVGEYGLGVELSGVYRDGRIFTDLPILRKLLSGPRQEFTDIDEKVRSSGLAAMAEFITVGGDYHHYNDLGRAYLVVDANGKSTLPLREQYEITEGKSGLIVLEASAERINEAVSGGTLSEAEILDGIISWKNSAEPVLSKPEGSKFKLLLYFAPEMAREKFKQIMEKNIADTQK